MLKKTKKSVQRRTIAANLRRLGRADLAQEKDAEALRIEAGSGCPMPAGVATRDLPPGDLPWGGRSPGWDGMVRAIKRDASELAPDDNEAAWAALHGLTVEQLHDCRARAGREPDTEQLLSWAARVRRRARWRPRTLDERMSDVPVPPMWTLPNGNEMSSVELGLLLVDEWKVGRIGKDPFADLVTLALRWADLDREGRKASEALFGRVVREGLAGVPHGQAKLISEKPNEKERRDYDELIANATASARALAESIASAAHEAKLAADALGESGAGLQFLRLHREARAYIVGPAPSGKQFCLEHLSASVAEAERLSRRAVDLSQAQSVDLMQARLATAAAQVELRRRTENAWREPLSLDERRPSAAIQQASAISTSGVAMPPAKSRNSDANCDTSKAYDKIADEIVAALRKIGRSCSVLDIAQASGHDKKTVSKRLPVMSRVGRVLGGQTSADWRLPDAPP